MATAPSVAVLPFQSLSADSGNDFFGEGLAEEILNALSQIDGLRVAARASSFSFKGRSSDLAEIGSKLKVGTVLDGSVRRSGNRVRVTVQLVEVASGFQVWSDRYDREMADIFDVQDEIARAIAEKLKVTLDAGQGGRLVKQATANVDAYDLYLRGRALLLKRGRYIFEAAECLRRAVDLDPKFAAAWSGLADAFTIRGFWGMATPGDTMPKALDSRAPRRDARFRTWPKASRPSRWRSCSGNVTMPPRSPPSSVVSLSIRTTRRAGAGSACSTCRCSATGRTMLSLKFAAPSNSIRCRDIQRRSWRSFSSAVVAPLKALMWPAAPSSGIPTRSSHTGRIRSRRN